MYQETALCGKIVFIQPANQTSPTKWMDAHETKAKYNIAETCASSVSMADLQDLSWDKPASIFQEDRKLTYGAIRGSENLLSSISHLYSLRNLGHPPTDNILVTPGAISANFILLYSLISKGSHVICHYPTYQQLYAVPASLGADVSLWESKEHKDWQVDIEELKKLMRPETRMIIINNPQNPTGAILDVEILVQIVEVARQHDLIVFCDEVYRPLFHSTNPTSSECPPSILEMGYSKTVATGSMSKAFALAGIRLGWIASCSPEIIAACAEARHYTTISVSQIDDQVASFALDLSCIENLLARNTKLARLNLGILESFIRKHRGYCQWNKPVAGTTAFVKFLRNDQPIDDVFFCERILQTKGVLLCPGSLCFGGNKDFKGFVRIGYVCETEVLREGLMELEDFMANELKTIPLATSSTYLSCI